MKTFHVVELIVIIEQFDPREFPRDGALAIELVRESVVAACDKVQTETGRETRVTSDTLKLFRLLLQEPANNRNPYDTCAD